MDKKALRKQIMSLRSHKTPEERVTAESAVFDTLSHFDLFLNAQNISSFVTGCTNPKVCA